MHCDIQSKEGIGSLDCREHGHKEVDKHSVTRLYRPGIQQVGHVSYQH